MHQLVIENPRKKGHGKWGRFERKHSMSLRLGDWKEFEFHGSKKRIVVIIEDSSRLIAC
jgi:hypothetical protein